MSTKDLMIINHEVREYDDKIISLYDCQDIVQRFEDDISLEREVQAWGKGWKAAINKVLSKIQNLPLLPAQKKYLWKEVKKLK